MQVQTKRATHTEDCDAAQRRLRVIIETDEDGYYVADVPALKDCHAQGKTKEEVLDSIREVILMCMRENDEESK